MEEVELPEILQPLSWLVGKWISENGEGSYPTIKDFKYLELLQFQCFKGQSNLHYLANSSHPTTRKRMHSEYGFLRIKPNTNQLALISSHNFGLTCIEEGELDPINKEIKLKSTSISRISFAKAPAVVKVERYFKLLDENQLSMVFSMATENTPMTEHLKVVYHKQNVGDFLEIAQ